MNGKNPVDIIRDIARDPLLRMSGADVELAGATLVADYLNVVAAADGFDVAFQADRRNTRLRETREGGIDRTLARKGHFITHAVTFMLDPDNRSAEAEREARLALNRAINGEWRRVRKTKAGKAVAADMEWHDDARQRLEVAQRTLDSLVRSTPGCRDVPVNWPTEWRGGQLRPISNAPAARLAWRK